MEGRYDRAQELYSWLLVSEDGEKEAEVDLYTSNLAVTKSSATSSPGAEAREEVKILQIGDPDRYPLPTVKEEQQEIMTRGFAERNLTSAMKPPETTSAEPEACKDVKIQVGETDYHGLQVVASGEVVFEEKKKELPIKEGKTSLGAFCERRFKFGYYSSSRNKRFGLGRCLDYSMIVFCFIALSVLCYEINVLTRRQSEVSGDDYQKDKFLPLQLHWRPWRPINSVIGINDNPLSDYRPVIMTDDENANEPFDDPYSDEYDEVEEDDNDKKTPL